MDPFAPFELALLAESLDDDALFAFFCGLLVGAVSVGLGLLATRG